MSDKLIKRFTIIMGFVIVLLVVAVVLKYNDLRSGQQSSSQSSQTSSSDYSNVENPLVEYKTFEEAAKHLNFKALEPKYIPGGYVQVMIQNVLDSMVEVRYANKEGNTLLYRTSEQTLGISGEDEAFDSIEDIDVDGGDLTINYRGDLAILAVYFKNNQQYVLYAQDGLPKQEVMMFMAGIGLE